MRIEQEIRSQIRNKIEETFKKADQQVIEKEEYKLAIVISKNCPHCLMIKEIFDEHIKKGTISLVEINSEEGERLREILEVHSVPQVVAIRGEFEDVIPCDFEDEGEEVVIKCGDKEF